MKKLFAFFVILFFAAATFAQSGVAARVPVLVSPPPVLIRVESNAEPIEITEMDIKVEILANIAVTKYDITFYNPNNRILEGDFDFAMTESQNVTAFALDINGKMRDGVPVEKEKGRAVFEEVVRRNIDPGLLEKTAGSLFKTRIYPLPAKGMRRVQITTEEKLKADNGSYFYLLPFDFKKKIAGFSLRVDVLRQQKQPVIKETPFNNFKFAGWNDAYSASFKERDYKLSGKLNFAVPVEEKVKVYSYDADGNGYFFASVPVAAPVLGAQRFSEITMLWDTSSSAGEVKKEAYYAFLTEFFKIHTEVKINFISFDIEADKMKPLRVSRGDWRPLKEYLDSLVYDGGTNLRALEGVQPKGHSVFLFSDGLDSFGQKTNLDFKVKTYTVNAAASYNAALLKNTAVKTGGAFINLNEVSALSAARQVSKENYKLASINYDKDKFEEVYPALPAAAKDNIIIAGIIKVKEASLELNFTDGITAAKKQKIYVNRKIKNPLARSIWAQEKIASLALDGEANKDEIIKLGKKYNIVTDYTSLLVLEDVQDYVKNKIPPPQELLAEYNKLLAEESKQKAAREKDTLDEALTEFEALKKWWLKDFPKEKPKYVNPAARADSYEASASVSEAAPGSGFYNPMSFGSRSMEASDGIEAASFAPASKATKGPKPAASIKIRAWEPDTPYLKEIKKGGVKDYYKKYLELKKEYKDQPSFYLDMSAFFQQKGELKTAVFIISNTAELKTDNPELLRITAQKLLELGEKKLALSLFEYLTELRGEEPQTWRDLAIAYEQNGRYQDALDNYYKVIRNTWDNRFEGIKSVVFNEFNNLISVHRSKLSLMLVDGRFIFPMPVDVRIVLGWSADSTDIDLHVTDPLGEKCYFSHKETYTGGKITDDMTGGYGPEEFTIKSALEGKYTVNTNYFSDSRQSIAGPVTLYLDLYTYYGTTNEKHQRLLIRADSVKENSVIGTLTFGDEKKAKAVKIGSFLRTASDKMVTWAIFRLGRPYPLR
jgi:tetratricopeptide (TPR) repeat protein